MTTVYCYDPLFLEHSQRGHPESRHRLEHIMRALMHTGLRDRLEAVPAQPASPEMLARTHVPAYVNAVREFALRGGGQLDADTYVTPASYDVAALAAGGTVEVVRAVLEGRAQNGIALVRPPGHHAEPAQGMGFCLFNNVAIAAQAAVDQYGLERILIVDWDVHHGNGTQSAFYSRADVLYFSTHQYPHYPGTGDWQEVGSGAGTGYTVNVPLPRGAGDAAFARVWKEILEPLAGRYRPQLILVSAGFDGHWVDPLAGLYLSLAGYWQMAQGVVQLAKKHCQGRLVVVLEGGYDLEVLAHGVANTCRALLGDKQPGPDPRGPSPRPERAVDEELQRVKDAHGLART